HRDIKPGNVLFDESGSPFLTDFGLAKLLDADSQLTRSTSFLGTPHYAAPEVASSNAGAATIASDVWSLGAMLYELLTGHPPFQAEGIPSLLHRIVHNDPAPIECDRDGGTPVPRDLRVICLKCLEKDPGRRYTSAAELASDLNAWLENRPIAARTVGIPERMWLRARRNPAMSAMAVTLVVALGLLGISTWRENRINRRSLAETLLNQARLELQTGQFDRRDAALAAVERSIEIEPSTAARDELISILAWPQLRLQWKLKAPADSAAVDFALERYARLEPEGIGIYDLPTDTPLLQLPHEPQTKQLIGPFTPDGRFLIVRNSGKSMDFWRMDTGELALSLPGIWFSLTFSQDGKWMTAALSSGNLHTIALDTPAPVACDLGAHTYRLIPKAISPDNITIAAKREVEANELLLVDARTGIPLRDVPVPRAGKTQRAAFTADGTDFFAAFIGGNIHQFSLQEDQSSRVLTGHSDEVTWLALVANDRMLVSQSDDETTRFWDSATGEPLATLPWSGAYSGATIEKNNRFVLRQRDQLAIAELAPSEVCTTVALPDPNPDFVPASGRWEIVISPDDRWLAVSAQQNLHLINVESRSITASFPVVAVHDLVFGESADVLYAGRNLSVFRYAIAPDGSAHEQLFRFPKRKGIHLAWAGDAGLAVAWSGTNELRFEGGLRAMDPIEREAPIRAISSAREEGILAIATGNNIEICRPAAPDETVPNIIASGPASSLVLDLENGQIIAGQAEAFTAWDLATGLQRWSVPHQLHSKDYRPLAFVSAAGKVIMSLDDFSISIVNAADGAVLAQLEHPRPHRIWAIATTSDARHIAVLTSGHLVKIWNLPALDRELAERGFSALLE
ncbi:MAG: protein kinase, partial [Verrucomicrobiae bacterium]|nr:protein kinase [Verrucomicrobiae bacterium]